MTSMRAAIYARYSTDRQRQTSIDDQVAVCRRHADAHRWTVGETHIYSDAGRSGASLDGRPGIQALLAAAPERPFDIVLVDDSSRVARDLSDALHVLRLLKFCGIRTLYISQQIDSDNEQAETLLTVHGLVDGLYLQEAKKKIKRGLRGQLERGFHTGSRIYGYRTVSVYDPSGKCDANGPVAVGKRPEIDETAAETIRQVFDEYANGHTIPNIADRLTHAGVPSPRGGKWTKNTLTRILTNERYVGKQIWGQHTSVRRPGTNQLTCRPQPRDQWHVLDRPDLRIVSDDQWVAVTERRAALRRVAATDLPRRSPTGRRWYSRHLLVGLATCGTCGRGFTIVSNGHGSPRYGCPNSSHNGRTACENRLTVRAKIVDPLVLKGLHTALLRPALVKEIAHDVSDEITRRLRDQPTEGRRLGTKREAVARKLANLVAAVEAGEPAATLTAAIAARESELRDIDARLDGLEDPPDVDLAVMPTWVQQQLKDLVALLAEAPERSKTALDRLNVQFTVSPVRDQGHPFLRVVATGDLEPLCGVTNLPGTRRSRSATPPPENVSAGDLSTKVHSLQEPGRPPASPSRRGRQGALHDFLNGLSRHRVVPAAGLRTVTQPVNSLPRKSSSDPRYRLRRQVEPRRDVHARFARRAPENDTCAAHQPGWLPRPRDQGFEPLLLCACRSNLVCVGHTHIRSHA